MSRVKRGTIANKRRKGVLKLTKGFKWGRKNKYIPAKTALYHGWNHAFNDRHNKKGDFRKTWATQINAASRENGLNYSKLITGLKKAKISIDRKILATLANEHPEIFKAILAKAK